MPASSPKKSSGEPYRRGTGPCPNCRVEGDGSVTLGRDDAGDATSVRKSSSAPAIEPQHRSAPVAWGAAKASRAPVSSVNLKRDVSTSKPSTASTNADQ